MRSFLALSVVVFVVAAALLSSLCLAADDATNQRIKLKIFFAVDGTSSNVSAKADIAVLEAFQKKYPNIDIATGTGMALDMDTGPLMAVAGGTSPDIIYVNLRQSDSYIRQGIVQPLDEFIEKLPPEEVNERFIPSIRPVVYRRGPDGKKHYYSVPYGILVRSLFYRKDVFRKAGLDPEKPPKDYAELLDYARKITNPDKGIYAIGMSSANISWEWYTFLSSSGGKAMVEDSQGNWKLTYNSDAGVRSAHYFAQLHHGEFRKNGKTIRGTAYQGSDYGQKFERGEIGMMFNYLDDKMIANIDPFLVGIAPVPGDGRGNFGSELNSTMMGLYAGTTDPKTREAAFRLMWFWDGPEARAIRTAVYVENGFGGFVNPAYLRKYGYGEYVKYVPRGWEDTLNFAMKHGNPEPYGQNCSTVYSVMDRPIEQILADKLGNKPPEEALPRIKQLLDGSMGNASAVLLEYVPENVMKVRRVIAFIVAIVMVLAFALVFRYLMKVFSPPPGEGRGAWQFRKYWLAYVILLPSVASIAVWQYVPLIRGAAIAFYDYRIMGGSSVIWLDNFADVLFDGFFWHSLLVTLYYVGLWIGLGFVAPIVLAIFLAEVPRLKILYRVLFYLPAVVSGTVVMFMWKNFYDPSAAGMLNKVLSLFHISEQAWLSNPSLAMLCVIIPTVWAGMGPGCLIYLAALKSVPDELYEAADLDGAGTLTKIWRVTIPMMKPLIIINLTGAFIGAFNSADFVLLMTNGGPNFATHVLGLEVFYNAFLFLKFGRAAAIGWLMGLLLLGFTAYQMKRLSNMTFSAGGK